MRMRVWVFCFAWAVGGCGEPLIASTSHNCDDAISCGPAMYPYCDGYFYSEDGTRCAPGDCPMRRADGTWACANLERAAEGCTVDIETWNGGVRCPPPGQGGAGGAGGNTPTDGGNGGSGGTGGAGGHAPSCTDIDPTANPADDPCVIHEDYGIFVSPEGDDEAEGTQGAPVATLTHAIELAAATDKRVYACNTDGDYAEALRLDESAAGVVVFGGFDCDTWAYDRETKARIAPNEAEAVIASGADGLELYDLEIVAGDAAEPGGSSIALQLLDTDADLVRVVLTAGNGAAGEQLAPASFQYTYPAMDELKGCDALSDDGYCASSQSGRCTHTCPAGDTTTGGGRGLPPSGDGTSGTPLGTENAGTGGGVCTVGSGGPGDAGHDGDDGAGAQTYGTLDASGWTPASGENGDAGSVGQGGGGGGGGSTLGVGGGGGCGGCGGAGAPGSTGGGSSIALLVHSSATTLTDCTLSTGNGGAGGDAQRGQRGQYNEADEAVAGFGGEREAPGCPGGNGGIGGNGGASGGGAGGVSVGILYSGTEPALDDATTDAITTGAPGSGGTAVANSLDTAGLDGVALAVLDAT